MRLFRVLQLVLLWGVTAVVAAPTPAQSQSATPGFTESEIKAAFILHLFNFVQWPDGRSPKVICITEESSVTASLRALVQAKPAQGLTLTKVSDQTFGESSCDVLFMPRGIGKSLMAAVDANMPTLTVSDTRGFAQEGGMIELERQASRVGLVINLESLSDNGLSVSSRLLRLARVINSEELADGS